MREQQEQLRRDEALAAMRRLDVRLARRTPEMIEEETEQLAERDGQDVIQSMIEKVLVRFEE